MLSSIILGGITLPKPTTMPKLDFDPVLLYSKPSVTGRLHNVYQTIAASRDLGNYDTVLFNRKFSFDIIGLTKAEYDSINAIDGTNTTLDFIRDNYSEYFKGNLDCTFFKFDEHIYFDAVSIEFTVTEITPKLVSIMYFAHKVTTPKIPNTNIMYLGEL